ncbi:alpha-glucosidase [Neobacillus notoginsengisoli]|uniref:oligo-1,6-glucosidase n=1 Tax=Neobacillus notoginsengisoli TaxID=1578198 RepID=A0A417YWG6_9BACI|nr:alpha-glucosidase [Neobacillus notoginsengisoli]RHW41664.1 alpha-glucosidase [Neobacillus notoginsengisoli]
MQQTDWWKKSVVYQVYPRSFYDSDGDGVGDIAGITQKLDYLKELGVDVVWLSPVYDSPNDDNGYDIRDYYSIMKEFGTMEDFDALLAAAHERGLKIIMDLVVNHTSDEHEWFVQSKSGKDNPYRDFYYWRDGKDGKEPNNWGSVFSGPAWKYDEATGQYYLHIFSKKQPDLNWENPEFRKEVYKMMKFWLDKGIDGFRMDVINFISKVNGLPNGELKEGALYGDGSPYFRNGPRIHEFLQEMNKEVLSKYDIMTVGEMPGARVHHAKVYTDPNNNELDMVFTFEHMGLDNGPGGKWDLKPLNLIDLKENLKKWQTGLHGTGWNSLYWNNHDQPRIVSRFGDDGEYRVESAKMLATCLHMLQGTPYIYQGEEIGMTNVRFDSIEQYNDVETLNMYKEKRDQGVPHEKIMESIYAKGRDNARTPMQWNDGANGGFTTGTPWIDVNPNYTQINAEQALADRNSIFYHYKHLNSLRKKHDVITTGDFNLLYRDHPALFAYDRRAGNEKLTVLCNFGRDEVVLEDEKLISEAASAEAVVQNYKDILLDKERLVLRPYEAVVFSQK